MEKAMKAKEMAEMLNSSKTEEEIKEVITIILNDFITELKTLPEKRHIKTPDALSSIVLELDDKWRAVARRSNLIRPDGFKDWLKHTNIVLYNLLDYSSALR